MLHEIIKYSQEWIKYLSGWLQYLWGWHQYLWEWLPPVGVCMGILALFGVFVPLFWDRIPKCIKALWIFFFLVLLGVEVLSISHDRKENQAQFEATVSNLTKIISQATGGSSYIYFGVTSPTAFITAIPVPEIVQGYIWATAYLLFVGEFPLHDVVVAPFCPMGWLPTVYHHTVYPNELGRPRQSIYLQFPPTVGNPPKEQNDAECHLFINTSNGSYDQVVHFTKDGDKWTWGSRLTKYGDPEFRHDFYGPGFSKDHKW
jgi:hypothetical protein